MSYVRMVSEDVAHRYVGRVLPEDRLDDDASSLITRRELALLSAFSRSALASLDAQRERNAHPPVPGADPVQGTLYLDRHQTPRWFEQRQRAHRTQQRERVERTGNPDDLVTTTQVARILGNPGPATIRSHRARFEDHAPAPGCTLVTATSRQRHLWRRSSVWAFRQRRRR